MVVGDLPTYRPIALHSAYKIERWGDSSFHTVGNKEKPVLSQELLLRSEIMSFTIIQVTVYLRLINSAADESNSLPYSI
jgi:hypothetical protein